MEKTQMKKIITICLVCAVVLIATNSAQATLWEIKDAGLQDTANFVVEPYDGAGVLNGRAEIPGDPGTKFNITLSGASGSWQSIQIGDGYDLPSDNAGLVAATGNGSPANTGFGDLTACSGYTMTLKNASNGWFAAVLFMNTGWTDDNRRPTLPELDRFYQDTKDWTWLAPGQTVTLTLNFSNTWLCSENYVWNPVSGQSVQNLNHVSNIGFQIGSNMDQDQYGCYMPSGSAFDVKVVPEPATIGLLGLGALSLLRKKR
jgi:hypothetical protein